MDEDHSTDLTLGQVQKKLRLTRRMVFYRIRTKDLKAHKHGWQWFVFADEIKAVKELEWYRNSKLVSA